MSFSSLRTQQGSSSVSVIVAAVIVAVVIAAAIATHGFGLHHKTMSASTDGQSVHMGE